MGSKSSKEFLGGEATKIEFGIEWQAVEKPGVYRRTVADSLAVEVIDGLVSIRGNVPANEQRPHLQQVL